MYEALKQRQRKLGVIGLGYVGLPIALAFSRHFRVVGFDTHTEKIRILREGRDPNGELLPRAFLGCDIHFTDSADELAEVTCFFVAVPTPVDEHHNPVLTPLIEASRTVARYLKPGDFVVYESTVYPGCTEEDCLPILETSGLKAGQDFHIGYSPERINPGDREHTLENTVKIISADSETALEELARIYQTVVYAQLHRAPNIRVAEAAKVIENTQRDLNIAFMNELSMICNELGINTYDVIEAAATKWNFQPFLPGLVGGHCIGVDPYYLTYKASEMGYHAKVILAGRAINDAMGSWVGNMVVKKMIAAGKYIHDTRVLVMGVTFKENVQDIRNSKVLDVVRELRSFKVNVDITDPYARHEEVEHIFGQPLVVQLGSNYDAIILAVAHQPYLDMTESDFQALSSNNALLADVKGVFRNRIHQMPYWSL